jgi:hypothetical protein
VRIQIHDKNTSLGKKLYTLTQKVLKRLFSDIRPEYIKNSSKLLDLGIPGKTALFIDDELICLDQCPPETELLKIIEEKLFK